MSTEHANPEQPLRLPVDVIRIQAMLPHRFPFLLVDRVVELVPHTRIRAIKNVTFNEPFFQGHFPGHPVMPGVLVIEAMAQAAGLLTQLSEGEKTDGERPMFYLVKVDNARFSRTVVPGDQLSLEVSLIRTRRNMGQYACAAKVEGVEVASAEILCAKRSGSTPRSESSERSGSTPRSESSERSGSTPRSESSERSGSTPRSESSERSGSTDRSGA